MDELHDPNEWNASKMHDEKRFLKIKIIIDLTMLILTTLHPF